MSKSKATAAATVTPDPDLDTIHDLLRHERRRNLIRRLAHIEAADGTEGVSVHEVSRAIAADELAAGADRDRPTDADARQVYVDLTQKHIPKIEAAGVLVDTNVLKPGPALASVRAAMNAVALVMEPGGSVGETGGESA